MRCVRMQTERVLLIFMVTVWCPVLLFLCWTLAPDASHHSRDITSTLHHTPWEDFNAYIEGYMLEHDFSDLELKRDFRLNLTGSDIILYLRIQKTGSTHFEERLKREIDISKWCPSNQDIKECRERLNFHFLLFKNEKGPFCGLHADFTRLQECAEDAVNTRRGEVVSQRHYYITTIRNPESRYISEWGNVQIGASWPTDYLTCNRKLLTEIDIPKCYNMTQAWMGVDLEVFMSCPHNLAVNRQTRMLADLRLINCYNTTGMTFGERHYKMLQSAKTNLKNMAFFGLTDHQELSQILFENTFHLEFLSVSETSKESKAGKNISSDILERIHFMNRFDVMLYQYAKDLFVQRLLRLAAETTDQQLRVRILQLAEPLLMNYK